MTSPDNRKAPPVRAGRPGIDLVSVNDIDEGQIASWMQRAAAMPGFRGEEAMSAATAGEKAPRVGRCPG